VYYNEAAREFHSCNLLYWGHRRKFDGWWGWHDDAQGFPTISRLHSCPVPWGYVLTDQSARCWWRLPRDDHCTLPCEHNDQIGVEYGEVRLRGLWRGSVVTSVSAVLFIKSSLG
jgi:hypothetical protein